MINHARTLLLNRAAAPGTAGEEYVPPDFAPLTLSTVLQQADVALFGDSPDRTFRNVRLRQVLTPPHACELHSYLTDLDSRLTYWPPHDESLFRGLTFGAGAVQLSGTTTTSYLEGLHSGLVATDGRLAPVWQVTIVDGSTYRVNRQDVSQPATTGSYTSASGLSSSISLSGSGLSLKFNPVSAPYPVWEVKALLRPSDGPHAALGQLGQVTGLFSDQEPYATFQRLFRDSTIPAFYRLSGALLAYIYRLDELSRSVT